MAENGDYILDEAGNRVIERTGSICYLTKSSHVDYIQDIVEILFTSDGIAYTVHYRKTLKN